MISKKGVGMRKINLDDDNFKLSVKEIRFLMGELTQEEFGKMLGMSKLQIWSRENEGSWSMKEITEISELSGVPINRITI